MPRGVNHVGPGRLQVRDGGGRMAVFGLPFLLAGVCVSLISAGLLPVQDSGDLPWFGRPLLFFMGVTFTLVGGILVFGRSWTTFDASARTIVKQMGLLFPMSATAHRIDDYTTVVLDFHRGDSDTADQFPVSLRARAGRHLKLFSPTDYGEARERAMAIASLFHFDIEDATTDHPITLPAAQADLSLQHRLRLEHQRPASVSRPPTMRSEISSANGEVRIVIPARPIHPACFLFFLIPAAVPIFLVAPFSRFFRESNTPDVVSWVFLAFLTMAFGVLPVFGGLKLLVGSRLGRTTIGVSGSGIRIDERRLWKTRPAASHAATDIVDIDYSTSGALLTSLKPHHGPQPVIDPGMERMLTAVSRLAGQTGLTIKTRRGFTTFGEGLPDDEIRYLHFIIRHAIVGGSMP